MEENHFHYFNPSPFAKSGRIHKLGDCVVRAICAATGKRWYEVYDTLCQKGRQIGAFGNNRQVYPHVLGDLGFCAVGIKREAGKKAMTVEDFCTSHPSGIYLLKVAHHLTCVIDGVVWDTWFPRDSTVYKYYFNAEKQNMKKAKKPSGLAIQLELF